MPQNPVRQAAVPNPAGQSASSAPLKRAGPLHERSYRHRICQGETVVTDKHLSGICNPTTFVASTYCTHCQDDFPLDDYQWADTGESVVAFRARMLQLVPSSMQSLNHHMMWIPWLAAAVVGGLLALVLPTVKLKIGGAVGGAIAMGFLLTMTKNMIFKSTLDMDFREYQ